ncbi:MAG: long-chain fatty acid--CoA ligase [Nevskia sp.]
MNTAQLLVRAARSAGARPALYHGETLLCDYRELALRVARIAAHLSGPLRLAPGERVAMFMRNVPEYLECLYATWHAGLVVVPINAKLHPREAEFILRDSGAAALFCSDDLLPGLAPLLAGLPALQTCFTPGTAGYRALYGEAVVEAAACAPDDVAWLFYTSGTTGRPKGVMLTHRNLQAMMACSAVDVDLPGPDDCVLYAAPFSHAAGMGNFAHMFVAARHVVPRSGGFDPAEMLSLARHFGGAFLFAAPTMVKRLVDHIEASGESPDGFRRILYGGGPMYLEDIRQAITVLGDRFVQIFGQGESPMTITALSARHLAERSHPRWLQRIASVGIAQAFVEVRIGDAQGRTLPAGEIGEVLVRGDSIMKGYWNNPEATAAAIRDGWLYTGDMGAMDEDGFLTLKDRSKDMIISGGSNIYPREVEEVLLQHPGVHEVSVIGRRHEDWGEEVVAFVVAKPGAGVTAAELDALCLTQIARFKRPRHYRFVAALPKSNYGKVLKTVLRELLDREAPAALAAAGR